MKAILERSAVLDGTRTRVLEVDGEGPPVLLLHGFTDSADGWRPVLRALARGARRAVAVDLPGSGAADPVAREGVLEDLSRFAQAFVAQYAGEAGAVLAGHSLGGLLALRAAERGDERLRAIAPISPAGLGYHAQVRWVEAGLQALGPIVRLTHRAPVPAPLVRSGVRWFYRSRLPDADPDLARHYAEHFRGMSDIRRFGRISRCLAEEIRAHPLRIDRIGTRVLLIWGGRDRICDVAGATALLDAVPGSRLVVLDECGHCPQGQDPEGVARLLLELSSGELEAPPAAAPPAAGHQITERGAPRARAARAARARLAPGGPGGGSSGR